jgi:hypothetical protein
VGKNNTVDYLCMVARCDERRLTRSIGIEIYGLSRKSRERNSAAGSAISWTASNLTEN